LDVSPATSRRDAGAEIAEEALAGAFRRLCRGGSWQGVARELAWRAVIGGRRDPRRVEALSDCAEAMMAPLIDEALWQVEQSALRSGREYLEQRPGDRAGALAAARLDASEEAERLVAEAYASVLEGLLGQSRRAA
jgi:hypothetical protein